MAFRTGESVAGESAGVDRRSVDIEPRRGEIAAAARAEACIAEQIGMLRDPERAIGRKDVQTMRTRHAIDERDSPRRLGHVAAHNSLAPSSAKNYVWSPRRTAAEQKYSHSIRWKGRRQATAGRIVAREFVVLRSASAKVAGCSRHRRSLSRTLQNPNHRRRIFADVPFIGARQLLEVEAAVGFDDENAFRRRAVQ